MQLLIRIMACFGIALLVVDVYRFVIGIITGDKLDAIAAGTGFIIIIFTLWWFPFYRAEVKNIWDNIKRNRRK